MTDPRECWDCGGTQFKLVGADSDLTAVCCDCATEHAPANTYIPDEHGRDHYEVTL
jgi:hypothetical protein